MPAYRKLPSGRWQATIRTPSGRRTKTDPLKAVVKHWAEESEAKIRRGEWTDPHDGRMTVGTWWEQWNAKRDVELATSRKEESHWRVHLKPRWEDVPIAKVTAWDVEAWALAMKKGTASPNGKPVGETTRGQVIRLLRALLSDAARHRLIPADPTSLVKVPTPPRHVDRILTREEWDRLDAATDGDPMIRSMLLAGLRWAEAAGLHAHRVDLGRARIEVVEVIRRDLSIKDRPKSNAGRRFVPMTPQLAASLEPLVKRGGLLFTDDNGRPLDYSNWRRDVWLPAVKKAGLALPLPTAHDLRHTFGTWLAEAGVPQHEIAALMGHRDSRATQRYMHAGDGRYSRALRALEGSPTASAV